MIGLDVMPGSGPGIHVLGPGDEVGQGRDEDRLLQQPEDPAAPSISSWCWRWSSGSASSSRSTPAPISKPRTFASGFGFLDDPAGFGISQTLIPYSEQDSYRRVFFVGLLNTLLVSALGIVFATILGFVIGLARLSPNWLLARLAGGYVELDPQPAAPVPDPVLVSRRAPGAAGTAPEHRASGCSRCSLFAADGFAYLERFGAPDVIAQWWRSLAEWIGPPAVYLNNRGVIMPRAIFGEGSGIVAAAFVIAILAVIGLRVWARRRQDATGARFPVLWTSLALLIGLPAARDARDRIAGQLRGAGAARLQLRRRHAA